MTKKLKLGFVGTGNIARQHMLAIRHFHDVELTCMFDANKANAESFRDKFGGRVHESVFRMLRDGKPDAVLICIPPFAHGEAEELCIKRYTPFFVEKPVSNNLEIAQRIAEMVRESGIISSCGYMNRYRRGILKAKSILANKTLDSIEGAWLTGAHNNHPWLMKEELSGGQLIEQLTHLFDTVRYLSGEIANVQSYETTRSINSVDFPALGVTLELRCGASAKIYCSRSNIFERDIHLNFSGPNVSIVFKGWENHVRIKSDGDGVLEIDGENDIFGLEDRVFLDAVKKQCKEGILSDYEQGLKTLEVSIAAKSSLRTGKKITL